MKIFFFSLLTFILCTAFLILDDVFTKTSTDKDALKKGIIYAALSGSQPDYVLSYPGANVPLTMKTMKALAMNDRAAVVKELGAYMKSYYKSPEFKSDFDAALKSYQPREFKDSAFYLSTYEKELKLTNDGYEQYKKQYTKDNIQTTADNSFGNAQSAMEMAKQYLLAHPELAAQQGVNVEEALKKLQAAQGETKVKQKEANTKIGEKFTDEKISADKAEMEQKYNETLARLKTELQTNLQNVPAERQRYTRENAVYKQRSNYKANLGSALKLYLSKTNDIDFAAEVKPVNPNNPNSLKKFTNPEYEKKNVLWKAGYRAGQEATIAARNIAQKWDGELK